MLATLRDNVVESCKPTTELARQLDLAPAAVSAHLSRLKDAGLVEQEDRGFGGREPETFPAQPNPAQRPPRHRAITGYEDVLDGDVVLVPAALPVNAELSENHDFSIVDLPEVEQTATMVHRHSMDNILRIIRTLARWIDAIGHRSAD